MPQFRCSYCGEHNWVAEQIEPKRQYYMQDGQRAIDDWTVYGPDGEVIAIRLFKSDAERMVDRLNRPKREE